MPIIFLKTQNSFEKNNISRDNNLRTLLLALVAIFFVAAIIIPTPSMAVHKGAGELVCGSCHTMHSSQGGTNSPSMGGNTGSFLLLRGSQSSRADIHKLCLQCHSQNGSQKDVTFEPHGKTAPKVHGGGILNWDMSKSFSEIGAGGDFYGEIDNNFVKTTTAKVGYGHSVGEENVIPPGNTFTLKTLSCTTCHDPHGISRQTFESELALGDTNKPQINVYRNLVRPGPPDAGAGDCIACHKYGAGNLPPFGLLVDMKSWIGGITGKFGDAGANYDAGAPVNGVTIWPVYRNDSTIAANNNVYDGFKNPAYERDGTIATWCSKCHGDFHEENVPTNRHSNNQDWLRHPVDYKITHGDVSGSGVPTIDWTDHYNTIAAGFKVPAANTFTDLTGQHYYADANDEDKVFCLSCHYAHAGPYYDALRWDYTSSVDYGEQIGKSIPSDKGCQQCHNR